MEKCNSKILELDMSQASPALSLYLLSDSQMLWRPAFISDSELSSLLWNLELYAFPQFPDKKSSRVIPVDIARRMSKNNETFKINRIGSI